MLQTFSTLSLAKHGIKHYIVISKNCKSQNLKLTAYIRFIIGGLYFLNFLIPFLTSDFQSEHETAFWTSELFAGLVALVYLAYSIRQGTKELQNDNIELPYPRILAILIESFNVIALAYILIQLEGSQFVSVIPNILIVTGMGYLLTQNLRIVFGKSR